MSALGVICLLQSDILGEDVCGNGSESMQAVVIISVGSVLAICTVPLMCCLAVCSVDDY